MLLIIVATGNHFFVDAALGGLVVVIGWLFARSVVATPARRVATSRAPPPPAAPDGQPPPGRCGQPHAPAARAARQDTSPPTESHAAGASLPVPHLSSQETSEMSPLKPSTNLAARMGRWSARHRKTAIFGVAFVIAAVVIGGTIGTKQLGDTDTLPGESGSAARILDEAFDQRAGETVLVQSETLTADDPAFRPRWRTSSGVCPASQR